MLGPLLLTLSLGADPRVDQVEKLASQGACDDLMGLAGGLSAKGDASDAEVARALARAAPGCGAKDKVLGLALTERAFVLAPQEPSVVTAHAEQLIAADQRGEAASVLDRLLTRPGADVRQARLLRGRLATDEGEYDLAVRVLEPIRTDSELGTKAQQLIAEAQSKSTEKAEGARRLGEMQQQSDAAAERAVASAAAHRQIAGPSGQVVWQANGEVGRQADKTFNAKGTKKGTAYVFRADGECEKQRRYRRYWGTRAAVLNDPEAMQFGIDFRVSIGGGEPQVLRTGQGEADTTHIDFVAPHDNVSIRVFDKSDADNAIKCHIRQIEVVTP